MSGLCANQDQEAKKRGSSNLEVAFLWSGLQGAQKNANLDGLHLNLSVQELLLPHAADSPNTFAGFRNLGNTCFANAALQTFLHAGALRRWIAEPRPYEQHLFMKAQLLRLQHALQKLLQRHSSNKWSVIVPVDVLQCLFDLGTERYGMLAGRQTDILECFKLFHTALGSPCNTECWFLEDPLTYPCNCPNGVLIGIGQLLNIIAADKGVIANSVPATLVLSILPYRLVTETDAVWVHLRVS